MNILDVQDIVSTYIENLLNAGATDDSTLFRLGYYNMVTTNTFVFNERIGSKYTETQYTPCMLENWEGSWEPLPDLEYIELNLSLTCMVRLGTQQNQILYDLHKFSKSLIFRYDTVEVTNPETEEVTSVEIAIGSGILRPIGASVTWSGRRYQRMLLPIDLTFSRGVRLGNSVKNEIYDADAEEWVLLSPIDRSSARQSDMYPVQLLSGGSASDRATKKNVNKENIWTGEMSFLLTDKTDFIQHYLNSPSYDQNKIFKHRLTVGTHVYERDVTITNGGTIAPIGSGAVISIVIHEAYHKLVT